jgi:uncharacterized alkaline shock family protein YloU
MRGLFKKNVKKNINTENYQMGINMEKETKHFRHAKSWQNKDKG